MSEPSADQQLDGLLDYLRRARGFDFRGYKRTSLLRRIRRRLVTVGIDQFGDYVDYLEVHPDEFRFLFDTILINVTSFFRDQRAWDLLGERAIPQILSQKRPGEHIRVWSAGCASGQESYTAAILLAEALGEAEYRERVKIYATDADDEALNTARHASYTANQVEGVSAERLEKFFELTDGRYCFRKDLRRAVIFGRHDLVQDAPISRVDLLICRNTLMYFNAEVQKRILNNFHFALVPNGYLFLGKGEMLLTSAHLFTPIDLSSRLYAKEGRSTRLGRRQAASADGPADDEHGSDIGEQLIGRIRLRDSAFDTNPVAQIVVDSTGALILANEHARALFALGTGSLGRPIQDLEVSYRPVELRSLITQATTERRPLSLKYVEMPGRDGDAHFYDVQVMPLGDAGSTIGTSVSFVETTRYRRLQDELERSKQELEMAYEELQSTVEELETTNEELQSTNEELETTNEELQSTNEELETMNEELQSTNEELETINEEHRRRTNELSQANMFLQSILTSIRVGVVVLNQDLLVQVWNSRSEDLWGLRSDEVLGKSFLGLDIGLPVERLRQPIRSCLTGESDFQLRVLDATNCRGKQIQCSVGCTPLMEANHERSGVILLAEEDNCPDAS